LSVGEFGGGSNFYEVEFGFFKGCVVEQGSRLF
jgi:hypothetical protein